MNTTLFPTPLFMLERCIVDRHSILCQIKLRLKLRSHLAEDDQSIENRFQKIAEVMQSTHILQPNTLRGKDPGLVIPIHNVKVALTQKWSGKRPKVAFNRSWFSFRTFPNHRLWTWFNADPRQNSKFTLLETAIKVLKNAWPLAVN